MDDQNYEILQFILSLFLEPNIFLLVINTKDIQSKNFNTPLQV